jgi:hypothetical protein
VDFVSPVSTVAVVVMVMFVAMTVVGMCVRLVRMRVMAMRSMTGISATHRIEGGDDLSDPRVEPFKHGLDDMVTQDQDTVRVYRGRQMPVSYVPSELHQVHRIAAKYLIEGFFGGHDNDLAAALQNEAVIRLQHDGFGQVYKNLAAVYQVNDATPQMPLVMGQHGPSERRRRIFCPDFRGSPDSNCPQHSTSSVFCPGQ